MISKSDVVVIGGGFYGCSIAVNMASLGKSVLLIEKESELLSRASYHNQARVHGGYHYPRSFLTGIRSRDNFGRFVLEFGDAIVKDFTKLYAIAKNSKVTARQFQEFCVRIGSPIKVAPSDKSKLFANENIEAVFEVQEYAFDAKKLAAIVESQMRSLGVHWVLGSTAESLHRQSDEGIIVKYINGDAASQEVLAKEVFVTTYSRLNELLDKSNLPIIPLRHELTEMALVGMPDALKDIAVTVMDGPFWSLMPFPPRNLMTLSHVRYTPHYQWSDEDSFNRVVDSSLRRESNFSLMLKDASRFLPIMAKAQYRDSLWEVKTILPRSDNNDSRPILHKRDHGLPGLNVVLGGKIDNIFDILEMINKKEL